MNRLTGVRRACRWLSNLRKGLVVENQAAPPPAGPIDSGPALPPKAAWPRLSQDTVFVIDRSRSMGRHDYCPTRLDGGKQGVCTALANRADVSSDDRVGLVAFNEEAIVACPLVPLEQAGRLKKKLVRLAPDDGTDIAQGLKAAREVFGKAGPPSRGRLRRVLLLTDGHGGHPKRAAKALKTRDAVLVEVIGIGGSPTDVNESLLRQVATTDSDRFTHYWFINDSAGLIRQYERLATGLAWKETDR